MAAEPLERQRLDKWLWVARFFKTRQLAGEAVSGGKVHLNGQRSKPGKEVRPGSQLRIHKGSLEWELEVVGLARQRLPASKAVALYRESEASRLEREQLVEQRRRERALAPRPEQGRPSKRDRRKIERFTGNFD